MWEGKGRRYFDRAFVPFDGAGATERGACGQRAFAVVRHGMQETVKPFCSTTHRKILQVGGKDSPYGRPSQLENNICNIPVARCVTGWSYLVDRAWNRTYLRVLGLDGGLREL